MMELTTSITGAIADRVIVDRLFQVKWPNINLQCALRSTTNTQYGVWILQPLVIAFMGLSLILWAFVRLPEWKMGNQRVRDNLAKQRGHSGDEAIGAGQEGAGQRISDTAEEDKAR
jgi:hypothetical protein